MREKKDKKLETTMPALPENVNRRPRGWKPLFEERSREKSMLDQLVVHAVIQGKIEKLKELIEEKGADPNARDEIGRSALKWARFIGRKEMAEYLESKGAKY